MSNKPSEVFNGLQPMQPTKDSQRFKQSSNLNPFLCIRGQDNDVFRMKKSL